VATPSRDSQSTATSYSGTTVQEVGVDEDDLLKTDGRLLVSLVRSPDPTGLVAANRVLLHRREADGSLASLAGVTIASDASFSGLYLASAAQRVVALGSRDFIGIPTEPASAQLSSLPFAPQLSPRLSLALIDIANPAVPTPLPSVTIDGRLTASRLIGNRLYLVTQWLPNLPVAVRASDERERRAALDRLGNADILPTITVGSTAPQPLVNETDCFVQPANASAATEITTVTVIDLGSPALTRRSRCFVGGSEAAYLSTDSLYLATTRYAYTTDARGLSYRQDTSTDVHKFKLLDDGLDYRGTGNVAGHLGWEPEKKSYRLSEYNGDLRVLSYTGETGWFLPAMATATATDAILPSPTTSGPPSPATLTILRENPADKSLLPIATLPNARRTAPIGLPGEQVYAVRFAGPRAYVVTFRRTDPLYILDLADPADPRTVGELKATGFSDYLFPVGEGLLLGVGKDASSEGLVGGVKLALFDVADPARPREIATRQYGQRGSATALDTSRHGINLFTQGDVTRIALPLRINETAGTPRGGYEPTRQGLARFEVSAAARSLTDKPMLFPVVFGPGTPAQSAYGALDVGQARSVQIGGQVYYLGGGTVLGAAW